jgi:hypothetical protein
MKSVEQQLLGICIWATVLCAVPVYGKTPSQRQSQWQGKVNRILPLLGHRNWIVIVDSAYPLQTSPGVQTIETGAGEIDVLQDVLFDLDHSIHVRPIVYMDAELPFVSAQDAPGVTQYRKQIGAVLRNHSINTLPHDEIIHKIDETGKMFDVIVLKTNLAIPYASVFLQLDCKYWSADAEARLRLAMEKARMDGR